MIIVTNKLIPIKLKWLIALICYNKLALNQIWLKYYFNPSFDFLKSKLIFCCKVGSLTVSSTWKIYISLLCNFHSHHLMLKHFCTFSWILYHITIDKFFMIFRRKKKLLKLDSPSKRFQGWQWSYIQN